MGNNCPKCNNEMPENSSICNLCGYKLPKQQTSNSNESIMPEVQNKISRVVTKTIALFFISFGLISLFIFGIIYFVYRKYTPFFENTEFASMFEGVGIIILVASFLIPIIIFIIAIVIIKQVMNNIFDTSNTISKGFKLVKNFTDAREFKMECKDCGHSIKFKPTQGHVEKKCPSCQSTNFKLKIIK